MQWYRNTLCTNSFNLLTYQGFKSWCSRRQMGYFSLSKLVFALAILSTLFHTCLKIITSSEQYALKNESFYPFHKFKGNPPFFMKLSWRSCYFVYFSLEFSFSRFNIFNSFCCKSRLCCIKLGIHCTCHHIFSAFVKVPDL